MKHTLDDPTLPVTISILGEGFESFRAPNRQILLIRRGVLESSGGNLERDHLAICVPPSTGGRVYVKAGGGSFRTELSSAFVEQLDLRTTESAALDTLLDDTTARIYHLSEEAGARASEILTSAGKELESHVPGWETMLQLRFLELIVLIHRSTLRPGEWGTSHQGMWRMADVIRHIRANYTEEFSLEEMAARCGLNSSYFSRAFREAAGIPLFSYINRVRIEKACLHLKRSSMSITEIAFAVGYNNLSFFNRYFRRLMHTSPREYRSRIRR